LPADTVLEGYNSWNGGFNLNGHTLTVGSGGINIYENSGVPKIYGSGSLTSSSSSLNFLFKNTSHLLNGYVIDAVISDNGKNKVGVALSGGAPGHRTHVDFRGGNPNTFTGDVYISKLAGLQLARNGVLSVRSNIFVCDGGYLILSGSNQITDSSRISLDGRLRAATLYFCGVYFGTISEKISELKVDGAGVIDCWYGPDLGFPYHATYLYLDDLNISNGSKLTIKNWALGHNHLLVRKDSANLYDTLTRIKFEGYKEWCAGLKDFDKDYWQLIPGIPEPSTYGAVLGMVGLGLLLRHRRGRCTSLTKPTLLRCF